MMGSEKRGKKIRNFVRLGRRETRKGLIKVTRGDNWGKAK